MAVVGRLVIDLMAKTGKLTSGLRSAQGDIRRFSTGAKGALGGLAAGLAAAAPVAITGLITKAITDVEEFNQAMRRSTAIMGDLSDETRAKMGAVARDVARDTKFSATQAAEAYFFLASAGLDAAKSMQALPQVAQFAQAGNFDLAQATDLLTDAQSALGLASKDAATNLSNMQRVSDVLVKANTLANASVEQFSTALTNKAGSAARSVGKDIEEVVAVLSVFADQGIKAEEAGTAFNIVMRDLQTKAIANAGAFQSMGISVFDAQGEMRNIADIISQLETALSGLSDEQQRIALGQLGFSDKSIAFTQALMGTSEQIRSYEEKLRMAGGTTKNVSDKMLTPLEKSLNQLRAAWTDIAHAIGPPLISALVNVAKAIAEVAKKVMEINTALGEFSGRIEKITGLKELIPSNLADLAAPGLTGLLDLLGMQEEKTKSATEALKAAQTATTGAATSAPSPPTAVASALSNLGLTSTPSASVSGVGAVQAGSAEAFNNLQQAQQRQNNQAMQVEKQQKKLLENAVSELKGIRRELAEPTEVIEFA